MESGLSSCRRELRAGDRPIASGASPPCVSPDAGNVTRLAGAREVRGAARSGFADRRLRPPVEDAMAARAQDHGLVALEVVMELRRDPHVATLAGAVTH